MERFDQDGFNNLALEALGFNMEGIILKSGRKSNWYVNWRNATKDAFTLDILSDYVISFTKQLGLNPDCFYGVPEGATKLAIVTQFKWARDSNMYAPGSHAMPMGRGAPKSHGSPYDRYFLGEPTGDTILLEDVTTTGGSLLKNIDSVAETANILAAIGLTTRMALRDDGKTVEEAVAAKGFRYHAMSRANELLPIAYSHVSVGRNELRASIEQEFERYGAVTLQLPP
jgi:orotate phosphoribosyltransferase